MNNMRVDFFYNSELLRNKKVVLVGCGSFGSRIAVDLVRAGIRNFHLIDPDILEPDNLVRHECGRSMIGKPKVEAVAKRLAEFVLDDRDLKVTHHMIDIIEEPSNFVDIVKDASLIIGTTDNLESRFLMNEVALETEVPLLISYAYPGAWGGEVIRVIPGQTPCIACWDQKFGGASERGAPGRPQKAEVYGVPVEELGAMPGLSADIGILTSLATRVALETILDGVDLPRFHKLMERGTNNELVHFLLVVIAPPPERSKKIDGEAGFRPGIIMSPFINPVPDCPYCSENHT